MEIKMADEFYQAICERIGSASVRRDESMKLHTTFRIGGTADYYMLLKTEREWQEAIVLCHQYQKPYTVIGNGSNLLVSDEGYRGVILQGSREKEQIVRKGTSIEASAGVPLALLAKKALEYSLTGLEFASGIPGSLGGAIVMNAGAYGGEMKQVITKVKLLDRDGTIQTLSTEEMKFSYRHSILQEEEKIALGAELSLQEGDFNRIQEKMEDYSKRRREKQPLEFPSAGSTFKRPEGYFASKLIMEAGLAGKQIGGARVSEKHCGFIINTKDATAKDVWELIGFVKEMVFEKFQVMLEPEVKLLGEFE